MKRTLGLPNQRPVREWIHTLNKLQPYRTARAMWLAGISAALLSVVMLIGAIDPHHEPWPDFHPVFTVVSNTILFVLLYNYNFHIIRTGLNGVRLAVAGLAGSIVIACVTSIVAFPVEKWICGTAWASLWLVTTINITAALIAYLLSLLLHNVTDHQQIILENEYLHSENLNIHYQTLMQQISPHFLFNSLNTLDGLISAGDERLAHQYLQQLAATFRYTLQQKEVVSLEEELNFTHSFIYMMQIRYGDALKIEENISPTLLHSQVAPISLQLLVENAIKHNVVSQRHPLTVRIETTESTDKTATLRVSNPIQPKADNSSSTGIGLANLNQRYGLLFGRQIEIINDNNEFIVEIPLSE